MLLTPIGPVMRERLKRFRTGRSDGVRLAREGERRGFCRRLAACDFRYGAAAAPKIQSGQGRYVANARV